MTTTPRIEVITCRAPDVVDVALPGQQMVWRLVDKITWYVLVVDGEVRGRRRTRAELAELLK